MFFRLFASAPSSSLLDNRSGSPPSDKKAEVDPQQSMPSAGSGQASVPPPMASPEDSKPPLSSDTPFLTRAFPPPSLADVPVEYIMDQLHNLAPHYWDKPETADCTIGKPSIYLPLFPLNYRLCSNSYTSCSRQGAKCFTVSPGGTVPHHKQLSASNRTSHVPSPSSTLR